MPKVAPGYLADRKRSIMEAAARVFSEKGVRAATMADVAREAGISPGAIYRYFDSKEALAAGCFSEGAQAIVDQWRKHDIPATGDPREAFGDLARATIELLNDEREQAETMLGLEYLLAAVRDGDEARLAEFNGDQDQVIAGIAARLRAMRAAGQLSREFDVNLLAGALASFYWGARLARLRDSSADVVGQFDQIVLLLGRASPEYDCVGAGAPPPGPADQP